MPDEGELVLQTLELISLQVYLVLLVHSEDLTVSLALLCDVLHFLKDLFLDRTGLVVQQLAGLEQARATFAYLLVEQSDADH